MRLPFPERIPLPYAVCFATVLCLAQFFENTAATFSLCCFLFIIVATLTFNLAGGLTRPSGGYVFFYAVLAVILGLFYKAFLGDPADSNLTRPVLTMEVTLGGMVAMFGAVYISRKLTTRRAFLANLISNENLGSAALGSMIVGLALTLLLTVVPYENGSILSALAQLNQFLPLAIILGTIYQIRKSGGTSSVNSIVLISAGVSFFFGAVGFSKQGMFTPPVCWLIAAASQRYRLSFYQILSGVLVALFMGYYLVPYSQYGRGFVVRGAETESKQAAMIENINTSISLLSDLGDVRQKYEQSSAVQERNENAPAYYDTPQGLFDRLEMISMDDAIINVTEQNGPFGYGALVLDFENLVPHFLWPGKPNIHIGNMYAHEIGMISRDDLTTGISFSPMGEAFHLGRWVGIFIMAPLLWIAFFTILDSLCGDVRENLWGLLALVLVAHIGPEGGLGGPIYMIWYGAVGIVFAALAAAYVMPILGSIFLRQRVDVAPSRPVRGIPRRVPSSIQSSRISDR